MTDDASAAATVTKSFDEIQREQRRRRQAAGATASASSILPNRVETAALLETLNAGVARAPVQTQGKRASHSVSFPAIFLSNVMSVVEKGSERGRIRTIIPLSLSDALATTPTTIPTTTPGVSLPLFRIGSRDRESLVFNVQQHLPPSDGSKARRDPWWTVVERAMDRLHGTIAVGQLMTMYENKGNKMDATDEMQEFEPFSIVMVRNAYYTEYADKNTKKLKNAFSMDRLDGREFAHFNALPRDTRFKMLFPRSKVHMPPAQDWEPLKDIVRDAVVEASAAIVPSATATAANKDADAAKRKKAEKDMGYELDRILKGGLGPVVRLSATRRYRSAHIPMEAEILPHLGLKEGSKLEGINDTILPLLDTAPAGVPVTSIINMNRRVLVDVMSKARNNERMCWLSGECKFAYGLPAIPEDEEHPPPLLHGQEYSKCDIPSEAFDGLHIHYPSWVDVYMRHHSPSFELLCTPNLYESLNMGGRDKRDNSALAENDYFPEGYMQMAGLAGFFQQQRYIERVGGIPCTRDFFVKRYGDVAATGSAAIVIHPEHTKIRQLCKCPPIDMSRPEKLLAQHGMVGFDVPDGRTLPSAAYAAARYYVVPMFNVSLLGEAFVLPVGPRADPLCPNDDPDDLPLAVNLTPEQGDAWVERALAAYKPLELEEEAREIQEDKAYRASTLQRDPKAILPPPLLTAPKEAAEKDKSETAVLARSWSQRLPSQLGVPYFLFFATRVPDAKTLRTAEEEAAEEIQELKRLTTPATATAAADPDPALPATVDELRRQLLLGIETENKNKHTKQKASAPAPDEPAAKRPRLDAPTPAANGTAAAEDDPMVLADSAV